MVRENRNKSYVIIDKNAAVFSSILLPLLSIWTRTSDIFNSVLTTKSLSTQDNVKTSHGELR